MSSCEIQIYRSDQFYLCPKHTSRTLIYTMMQSLGSFPTCDFSFHMRSTFAFQPPAMARSKAPYFPLLTFSFNQSIYYYVFLIRADTAGCPSGFERQLISQWQTYLSGILAAQNVKVPMWERRGGGEEAAAIFIRGSHLIIDRLVTRMCMAVFASCSCAVGKPVCVTYSIITRQSFISEIIPILALSPNQMVLLPLQ